MYTLDFETEMIIDGSPTPPKPVGCAIRHPDGQKQYWAFGHPVENNCTWEEFYEYLLTIWDEELIGHNIFAFDLDVAEYWFGLEQRDPLLTHDTLFQAYLLEPHSPSLSLKPLCENWLGIEPKERNELYDWIMANVKECRSRKQCGAYISRAPGGLVGNYAEADVEDAYLLHQYCYPKLQTMLSAYDRERVLAPILSGIKRKGIRINVDQLEKDYRVAMEKLHKLDDMVRTRLKQPDLNPGSDAALVRALADNGFKGFLTTPTGKMSASKDSLEGVLASDPDLQKMLHSRSTYATLTGTFMSSWLETAKLNGGTINPQYNQVRNPDGFGTRTGRLSSSNPNGQNIPGPQGEDYFGDPFPEMRSYCLPDEGCVWYSIDFKSQEPRLTAHFEDGALMQAFNEDPDLDPYIFIKETVGGDITRHDSKQVFLGLVYAMGAAALAERIDRTESQASSLRTIIKAHIPDVVRLDNDCKKRFKLGLPITTLGGRTCYCEPPANGRTWEYKALNLLIQGSAADQTKEAIIHADEILDRLPFYSRLLGTVHDEINLCAPPGLEDMIMDLMTEAANALPCDVPMRVTLGVGNNWAEAAKE